MYVHIYNKRFELTQLIISKIKWQNKQIHKINKELEVTIVTVYAHS
jgi:transposase